MKNRIYPSVFRAARAKYAASPRKRPMETHISQDGCQATAKGHFL